MYVRRKIRVGLIWRFAWRNLLVFALWDTVICLLFVTLKPQGIVFSIPFLPVSTIGIAVAFYLGFKNNQSYDRFWEGRKTWGSIVNVSRQWANQVLSYLRAGGTELDGAQVQEIHRVLVYRHLAWTNALRLALRHTTIWDRDNLSHVPEMKLDKEAATEQSLHQFLDDAEFEEVFRHANAAAHIVRTQGRHLRKLKDDHKLLTDYQFVDMMRSLERLYDYQGVCERIKNTPLPRQYAYYSALFVYLFVALLPFGLTGLFVEHNEFVWASIPASIVISWVYITMEQIGDLSEDPFENFMNDVPMTTLCRTIEIDLREMLNESNIPPKLKPENDILM